MIGLIGGMVGTTVMRKGSDMKFLKRIEPKAKAKEQLYQAQIAMLDALAAKEHYQVMCDSLVLTISRLEKYLDKSPFDEDE